MGDFNARTSDENDFICNDETDDFLPLDYHYVPDNILAKRLTQDLGNVSASGRDLLDFCKSSGLRIVNGRVNKNESGNFTCFTQKGNSVVDYVLVKEDFLEQIADLNVGNINEFSDHAPIQVAIKANLRNSVSHHVCDDKEEHVGSPCDSSIDRLKESYVIRYVPDEATAERIRLALYDVRVHEFLALISNELQNPGVPVEVSISKLRSKLLEISEICIPSKILFKKAYKKHNSHRPSPWFDDDCKQEKKLLNKARKTYQFALKNDLNEKKESLRNFYFSQRGKYHQKIKSKRKVYNEKRKENLWNLKSCSPKEFW